MSLGQEPDDGAELLELLSDCNDLSEQCEDCICDRGLSSGSEADDDISKESEDGYLSAVSGIPVEEFQAYHL